MNLTVLICLRPFSCLLCGEKFAIAQDLSLHVRKKQCKTMPLAPPLEELVNTPQIKGQLRCSLCHFTTQSEAELLYHKAVLHDHLQMDAAAGDKVKCPICVKSFRKFSLMGHLRKHTNERIFSCPDCKNSYTRKATLVDHMKKCGGELRQIT